MNMRACVRIVIELFGGAFVVGDLLINNLKLHYSLNVDC